MNLDAVEMVLYNFSLVILMVFFYYLVHEWLAFSNRRVRDLVLGVGFGLTAAISIFLSVPVMEGVLLDSKMVLGALAGFFGGLIPGAVTAIIAVFTRTLVGGIGTVPGVIGLVVSVLAGLGFRYCWGGSYGVARAVVITGLGIAVASIQTLAGVAFIPLVGSEATREILRLTIPPTFIVYIPATLAIGAMIAFVEDRARAHRALQAAHAGLEQRIAERTAELQRANRELATALEELETTQRQLVVSEKQAALGQLTARIAHELNTPLGAISSVTRNAKKSLLVQIPTVLSTGDNLPEPEKVAFLNIAAALMARETGRDAPLFRSDRKQVLQRLEGTVLENKLWAAEAIGEHHLDDRPGDLESLIRSASNAETAIRALAVLGELRSAIDVTSVAVQKAATAVSALQSYGNMGEGAEVHPVPVDLPDALESKLKIFDN